MRVLYVYWSEFAEDQAHANQIVHTCNALADCEHNVTVLSAGDLESYARTHGIQLRFDYRRVSSQRLGEKLGQIFYYLASLLATPLFDVVLTRDVSFLRVVRAVPLPLCTPIVYEAHKAYSYIGQLSEADERSRCGVAHSVVTISRGVADDLTELGIEVSAIVPDAADLDQLSVTSGEAVRASIGVPTDGQLVVYTGSLSTWKNDLELAIEAFASVVIDRPETRLVIVGGGADSDELQERAREIIPEDVVKFTGHVSQTTVFEYLDAADVGIVPLRPINRIAARYTSPLKLYEYLASDLNVVASDVPSIALATSDFDGVFTYEPGNSEVFDRTLRQALDSPDPDRDPHDFSYARRAEKLEPVLARAVSQS